MQRRKNIFLLVLLLVLLVATAGVWILGNTGDVIIDKDIFRNADLTKVDRVRLTGSEIELEISFDGRRWNVNGYRADANLVEVLFATLQQAEPKRAAAASITDSLTAAIEAAGTTVEIFEGELLLEKFKVLGSRGSQTFFKLDDESTPYLMTIPGYRVYVAGIFELSEPEWRDKLVFDFNWRNFEGLKVEFSSTTLENFEVAMGPDRYFTIVGEQAVDTTRLNDFLDAVSYLTVDQYVPTGDSSRELLDDQNTKVMITIHDVAGNNYQLIIHETSRPDGTMIGTVPGGGTAYFGRQKLSKIVKPKSWFLVIK